MAAESEPADKVEEEAILDGGDAADQEIGEVQPEPVPEPAAPAAAPTTTPPPTPEEVEAARQRKLQADAEDKIAANRRLQEEIKKRRLVAGDEANGHLAAAMRRGDVEGVQTLLDNGADPNAYYGEVDFERCSLAHMAVYWDHSIEHEVEIIKVLIDSGKVNWDQTCPNQDHSVPLYEAVRHNNTEAFNLIFPLTTNFASRDYRGRSMLYYACGNRNSKNDAICAALSTVEPFSSQRRVLLEEYGGNNVESEHGRRLKAIHDDPTSFMKDIDLSKMKAKMNDGRTGGGLFGASSVIPEGEREL